MDEPPQVRLNGPIRRIVWSVISHMRVFLQIDIHPVISSAFMSIHNFFQNGKPKKYKLYIILITSVFTSCKKNEVSKSLFDIFPSFLKSCEHFSKVMNKSILYNVFGIDNFSKQISNNDIQLVNNCELDLIEANNFQIGTGIPLNYITENVFSNLAAMPHDISSKIHNSLVTSLCALLCSEHCSDFEPEIMAVAATIHVFGDTPIPGQTLEWIQAITNDVGQNTIEDAQKMLIEQINEITSQ